MSDQWPARLLDRLSDEQARALVRIAKHPTKGARPFFRNPHAMIALRDQYHDASRRTPT
jgi:hypothetical protein